MLTATDRFPRSERLLERRDFQRVARAGVRVASRYFVILVAPRVDFGRRRLGSAAITRTRSRLGVTTSRKVGKAVVRNHLKRGIREWFRHSQDRFSETLDIVVIARRNAAVLTVRGIDQMLTELMKKHANAP